MAFEPAWCAWFYDRHRAQASKKPYRSVLMYQLVHCSLIGDQSMQWILKHTHRESLSLIRHFIMIYLQIIYWLANGIGRGFGIHSSLNHFSLLIIAWQIRFFCVDTIFGSFFPGWSFTFNFNFVNYKVVFFRRVWIFWVRSDDLHQWTIWKCHPDNNRFVKHNMMNNWQ